MSIRNIYIVFCFLLFLPPTYGQSIDQSFKALLNYEPLANASVSFNLINLADAKVVKAHQPEMALIPASSMKVLTTSAALGVLGANHTFKTQIYFRGQLDDDGTLIGDIIIKGNGDPTFGAGRINGNLELDETFNLIAKEIKNFGIQCIDGSIIVDVGDYGSAKAARTWSWEDLGNYYASGAWSLNVNENLFQIYLKQKTNKGAAIAIQKTVPEIPFLKLQSEITAGAKGSGDNAYIYGGPYQYERFIRGSIPPGNGSFKIKGSIPDPEYFGAYYLKNALQKEGIPHIGYVTKSNWLEIPIDKKSLTLIYQHQSPKLKEIVALANSKSINVYCDALLLELGKEKGNPTLENGIESILDFWENKGLDRTSIFLMDGSGLSPRNSISSASLSKLFYLVAKDENLYPSFFNSLSIAGKSGTLGGMLQNSPAKGKVFAKSGYIDRVLTYTGYVHAQSGKKYAFSIMINNFKGKTWPVRQKLEKIFESIYKL